VFVVSASAGANSNKNKKKAEKMLSLTTINMMAQLLRKGREQKS